MPDTFTLTEEQATLLLSLEEWPSFHEDGFELPLILEIEKHRPQWLTFGDRGLNLFGVVRLWQALPTRLGLIAAKCALRRICRLSTAAGASMIPAELEQIQQRLEAAEKKLQRAEARCTALMAQRESLQRQVEEARRHRFLFAYGVVCNHE